MTGYTGRRHLELARIFVAATATVTAGFSPSASADFRGIDAAPPPAQPLTSGWDASVAAPAPAPEATGPLLYSIGNPTAEEQLYLEYINRARANPRAEGVRMATTTNADVLRAYQSFGVNLVLMQAQLAAIAPRPPLSMNATLSAVARAHTQDMFRNNFQGHNGTNGSTTASRIIGSGYTANAGYYFGESVFARAYSVFYGHAAFEVDWGGNAASGGMQSPPGHRNNNHSANFREVGIGVVLGSNQGVGPQLVTQDFASRSDALPLVTGVIYEDKNRNAFYDLGEGIGGVTVTVVGSNYYAVSAGSGGYSVPVPTNGAYTVSFSGGQVPAGQRAVTVTGGNNVKLDYIATPAAVVRGDFNGDGRTDYLLFQGATRKTAIWKLRGNAYLGGLVGPTLPAGWVVACVADLNRDRKPDYVLFNTGTRQTAVWFLNNAALIGSSVSPTLPAGWRLVAATDMNNDGHPDYVLFNPGTRQSAIWYLNSTTFVRGALGRTLPSGWTLVDAVDFNGDRSPDFLLTNLSTRQTVIWYLNRGVYTSGVFGPALPVGWTLQGAANFNADTKPDYVLLKASTRQTALWYLNGAVRTGGAAGPTLAAGYSLVSP